MFGTLHHHDGPLAPPTRPLTTSNINEIVINVADAAGLPRASASLLILRSPTHHRSRPCRQSATGTLPDPASDIRSCAVPLWLGDQDSLVIKAASAFTRSCKAVMLMVNVSSPKASKSSGSIDSMLFTVLCRTLTSLMRCSWLAVLAAVVGVLVLAAVTFASLR